MNPYTIILLAPLFWVISSNCMHEELEFRLIRADELKIQQLEDTIYDLTTKVQAREADIKMLLDSFRLERLMKLKFTRDVETQTDAGTFLLKRSVGSAFLPLEGKEDGN